MPDIRVEGIENGRASFDLTLNSTTKFGGVTEMGGTHTNG